MDRYRSRPVRNQVAWQEVSLNVMPLNRGLRNNGDAIHGCEKNQTVYRIKNPAKLLKTWNALFIVSTAYSDHFLGVIFVLREAPLRLSAALKQYAE